MKTLRRDLFVAFLAVTTFLCIIPIFTYIYFAKDLSPKEKLISHNNTGIELFDYKNRPFFTFYSAKNKTEIPLSQVPKITQRAVIAMEDKDFYSHPGFSITGILRSAILNIKDQTLSYGGSTITQQLVKNSLLNPKKEILRKYQEIILASEIERRYTKDQILEMYLNSIYFGEGAFGIEEAANTYFNKKARDLNLSQSAILVALLPSPTELSLFNGNLSEAKVRQRIVLDRMVKQGYITPAQKDEALKKDLELVPHISDLNNTAPHFALMVRDQLIKEFGEEAIVRSGFKVKTTLNLNWQTFAEKEVTNQVENLKKNRVSNGAALVLDPKTGEVRVMVGSKNWFDNKFGKVNLTISPRPPGSAFKPIVYIKAFEEHLITPATILRDEPTTFANFDEDKFFASYPNRTLALTALSNDTNAYYKPQNYDRRFRGSVTVRKALANSLNVPAVSVIKKVGVEGTLDSAKTLGITTLKDPANYGLSLVLGTGEVQLLELTNAYGVFANGGYRNTPTLISEIQNKEGNIVYKYQPNPKLVIDEKYTFLISSILSDNKTRSEVFGKTLNISRPAAVKTGTTEDFKDAWTIGYTPSLVVGVWVGNNFNEPMDGIAGSLGAAPIWRNLMEKFLAGTPVEQFEPPAGIVKMTTCGFDLSNKQASSSAIVDYFAEGTEPPRTCLLKSPLPSSSPSTSSAPVVTPEPTSAPTITLPTPPAQITNSNFNSDKSNSSSSKSNKGSSKKGKR